MDVRRIDRPSLDVKRYNTCGKIFENQYSFVGPFDRFTVTLQHSVAANDDPSCNAAGSSMSLPTVSVADVGSDSIAFDVIMVGYNSIFVVYPLEKSSVRNV